MSSAAVEVGPRTRTQQRVLDLVRGRGMLAIFVLVVAFFWWQSPFFFTTGNLLNISRTSSVLGLMALTQTFLLIAGGIDISIGANAAFSGVVLGRVHEAGLNIWLSALVAVLIGVAIGATNGTLTVRMRIDPLVVSLGSFSIFTGLAFMTATRTTLIIDDSSFAFIGSGDVLRVPFPFVLFVVAFALAFVIERHTRLGRAAYALGGNAEAARLSGIRVDRLRMIVYAASGFSAGLAGVIITSQISAASPNIGAEFLLSVVTAVILGGASLKGGQGSVLGTLIAVAILGVLRNGFSLMQVSSFAQNVALGILLIVAVTLDQATRRTYQ